MWIMVATYRRINACSASHISTAAPASKQPSRPPFPRVTSYAGCEQCHCSLNCRDSFPNRSRKKLQRVKKIIRKKNRSEKSNNAGAKINEWIKRDEKERKRERNTHTHTHTHTHTD